MTKIDEYEALQLENQLCFPLYACARNVINLYTPFFKPLGITYTQYIVFLVLWNQDSISVGELGKKLYLDNGTLTPLLKKMQEAGYVSRERSDEDERVVMIRLTQQGWALREKAGEIPARVAPCVRLSPEDAAALHTLLYKLLNQDHA